MGHGPLGNCWWTVSQPQRRSGWKGALRTETGPRRWRNLAASICPKRHEVDISCGREREEGKCKIGEKFIMPWECKIYYVCIETEIIQQKSVVGTLKSKLHVMLAVLWIRERSGVNSNALARMSVVEMERRSTVAPWYSTSERETSMTFCSGVHMS